MAENSEGQEKTEEPTPKRLQDARNKGQVARSRELTTMAMMMAAAAAFIFFGPGIIEGLLDILEYNFVLDRETVFDEKKMADRFIASTLEGILTITPFFIVMAVIAFMGPIALSGWVFSLEAMGFKWSKLDPVKGLGRILGARGAIEFFKAMAKFLLIGTVALLVLYYKYDEFLTLGRGEVDAALANMGDLMVWTFLIISMSLIVLAAVDVPFQLWDHTRQLRMTRQEVKDEFKQSEGDPQLKQHIRQLQQEMAQKRMMEEVPRADVVVTNPTHYAVAMKYDQATMPAPVVVAKGVDFLATQIRSVAQTNEIPVLEAPPLARALYNHAELDQEIPGALFQAVAQILAYLYFLREGGPRAAHMPDLDNLPVPKEMDEELTDAS
ncbi:MAG: flagellar biosynthesis protein FlhB [Pseudomonadota bacterium]